MMCRTLVLLCICFTQLAWAGWQSHKRYSPRELTTHVHARLSHLVIEVNSVRHLLYDGQVLDLVYGDKIKPLAVLLKNRNISPGYVNVVGFRNPSDDGQDLGYLIDTNALLKRFSYQRAGKLYAISIGSADTLHGEVFLRLHSPVLRYAILKATSPHSTRSLVLRNGDTAKIGIDDRLQITKVSTSINDSQNIHFNIYRDAQKYEIRFEYRKKLFATIPLEISSDPVILEQK